MGPSHSLTLWVLFVRTPEGGEGLGEDVCCLQCLGRTEGEAFLAVPALLGGDGGNKADLFAYASIYEADGVLLFDLIAVSDAEAAMDAEGGLLFKAVPVRPVLFGQFLELEGIRGMGKEELEDHLTDPVHLLGAGTDDEILFYGVDTGYHEFGVAPALYLHRAEPAAPEGFQVFMVTEGGDCDPLSLGHLEEGHARGCHYFFAVYL